jgi:lysine-N-methylase
MSAFPIRQPSYFARFQCLAADCEDTCCGGWSVPVDRPTYERYLASSDESLRQTASEFMTRTAPGAREGYFAIIQMKDGRCPLLHNQLCSLHERFGEAYLPRICEAYPRSANWVDGVLERSLQTSCPEAARLVMLEPSRLKFEEGELESLPRTAGASYVETGRITGGKPYEFFHGARRKSIAILQDRSLELWERMAALGDLCDRLETAVQSGGRREFEELLGRQTAVALAPKQALAFQLEVVISLIVSRMSEYVSPAFRECYGELMKGLEWTPQDSFEDLARRLAVAHERYYAPFLDAHPYMFENLLVNYAHRTMFPFGPQRTERMADPVTVQGSITDKFRLMATYLAMMQTVAAGAAAVHREKFGAGLVVRVVYAFSRSFEHSLSFPPKALEILAAHGITDGRSAAALTRLGRT